MPRIPAPERRTRGDLAAVAVLVAVVVVVVTALWWTSDARNATVSPATGPAAEVTPVDRLPPALAEIWRAPSPATPVPVVDGGTVVTGTEDAGAAGEVAGRDLGSGAVRWSYRRDLPLCTVAAALGRVVTVYQRDRRCTEVTSLGWADGRRGPQRNSPVEAPTRLAADGDHVAATGHRYLEVWRADLVRTLVYGRMPTPAQPDTQPRPDCTQGSTALEGERLALIEHCPAERSARLTVQRAHPERPDQPEVDFSVLLPGRRAQLVALSTQRVAVALPDPARLLVFGSQGRLLAEHPLRVPDADLQTDPPGGLPVITETPTGLYWFTGSTTVALEVDDLRPRWTRTGTLGSGSAVGARLALPTPGALSLLDTGTGESIRTLPVDRGDYLGPVRTAVSGDVVLEQRGGLLVALR